MSSETLAWLNQNTLIGFTSKRGNAWHWRENLQVVGFNDDGTAVERSNHYPEAIPVGDVVSRLFDFDFVPGQAAYLVPFVGAKKNAHLVLVNQETGLDELFTVHLSTEGRRGMLTSDTFEDLGLYKTGQPHNYREVLVEALSDILDTNSGDLGIASAGLLKGRKQAWVQVEMPENITTAEGFEFRPFLAATTSIDGTLSTEYKTGNTAIVCDNTLAMFMHEAGARFKVKHSKHSQLKLADAREALALVHSTADNFAAEVKALCSITVTDKQFASIQDIVIPVADEPGRGRTVALDKRGAVSRLYRTDERASTWKGTGLGVIQAFNTYMQHEHGSAANNSVKNMENTVSGVFAKWDAKVFEALCTVTETDRAKLLTAV